MRAGDLPAFINQPRFEQDRKRQVNVVATQQNVLADGNPSDIRDRTGRTRPQFEQTEIRSAAADIDDQDVPRLGIMCVQPFPPRVGRAPQRVGRAGLLQPAIECRLWLLEQPHAAGKTGFLRGIQGQPLRGRIERRGDRNGDVLLRERAAGTGETVVPGAAQIAEDQRGGTDG